MSQILHDRAIELLQGLASEDREDERIRLLVAHFIQVGTQSARQAIHAMQATLDELGQELSE